MYQLCPRHCVQPGIVKINHVRPGGQINGVRGSVTPTQQTGVGPPLPTFVFFQHSYTFSEFYTFYTFYLNNFPLSIILLLCDLQFITVIYKFMCLNCSIH